MDYKEILSKVSAWKGCNKEYWYAVNLLKEYSMLTEIEVKSCNRGLDCHTESLVTHKMKELADFCKLQLPAEQEKTESRKRKNNPEVIIENTQEQNPEIIPE